MTTLRRTALIVGALFWISNLATIIGSVIAGPIPNAHDALATISPHSTQVVAGTLIARINDAAIIGYAVVLFPILKRYSESLALAYVAFKVVEAALLLVGGGALLSLIPLSERFLAATDADRVSFDAVAGVVLSQQFWAMRMAAIAYVVATPILNFMLYQARLVPRFIAVWGLVAVALLAIGLAAGVSDPTRGFEPAQLLVIPIILWELAFATWLLARGFSASAVDASRAATR